MSAPQSFAVAAAIVTTLRAATGLGAPDDNTADVPVFDGPTPTDSQILSFVAVGWNGNYEGDIFSGSFNQDHTGLGGGAAAYREETGRVECVLVVGDGGVDFTTCRTLAATNFGLVSDAIRASHKLGLSPVIEWAHVTEGEWQQGVSRRGAFIKLNFAVEYLASI